MLVPVNIRDKATGTKRNQILEVSDTATVTNLKEKIAEVINLPKDNIKIVFGGHVLDPNATLGGLLLGPSTSVLALVAETSSSAAQSSKTDAERNPQNIGGFYVYCKQCNDVTRGKLRICCSGCSSPDVIAKQEPTGWIDVLRSNRIPVFCENCDAENLYARFTFKCVPCGEICAALSQTRGNWESAECVICCDAPQFVFDFGCNHPSCKNCFTHYAETQLKEAQFRFRPPFGYTLRCPATECDFCITDVHHFRILGPTQYAEYQRLATEKLIALDESGYFCPFPGCGASFLLDENDLPEVEDDQIDDRIQCIECRRLFCRNCREAVCKCETEDRTNSTINLTTKKCPGCNVSTERNGGCAHMTCTHCHLDWCWICVTPWREDCQWDHWFG
ncbi:unnamed protein product, partial [Mesorhabditis belari]|uniref:E3 ubiquitin-protein ligase parkin n=1 Tax=Mesorhabditis belari TaxID=2138241 RepID=A0AAF3E8E9_9BILA